MPSFTHILYVIFTLAFSITAFASPIAPKDTPLTIDGMADTRITPPGVITPIRVSKSPLNVTRRLALGFPVLSHNKRAVGTVVTKTGNILVTDYNTKVVLGFIGQTVTSNGHFGIAPTISRGLMFMFTFNMDGNDRYGAAVDILAMTSSYAGNYPFMGGVVGVGNTSDDLGVGSSNLAYIQGTTHAAANSPPVTATNSHPVAEHAESAIWNYDDITQEITTQWINTDNSKPGTVIMYVPNSNALILTGDPTTFTRAYPLSVQVSLTFV